MAFLITSPAKANSTTNNYTIYFPSFFIFTKANNATCWWIFRFSVESILVVIGIIGIIGIIGEILNFANSVVFFNFLIY
jgi:hypothetical protein